MRKHRLLFFLRTNTAAIFRDKPVYGLSMGLMTAGLMSIYVLLCGFFCYAGDLRAKLTDEAWQDIIIFSNWAEQDIASPSAWDVPAFRATPRGSQPYRADESAILTYEDLIYIDREFGSSLTLKAFTEAFFSTERNDYTMFFISDGYIETLRPAIDEREGFFIISKEYLEDIKEQFSNETPPRQFPFEYSEENDQFTDFSGNPVRVYFLEDMDPGYMTFFTQGGSFDRTEIEDCIYISLRDYFSVYFPMDNCGMEVRVRASDQRVLGDLLNYLNTAHKGGVTYSCIGVVALELQSIHEQFRQFTILMPLTVLVVLMVSLNFMGLQLLNQRRRRKEQAIQMACGAQPGILSLGLMYSAVTAVLLASIAALLLGAGAMLIFEISIEQVVVSMDAKAAGLVTGFAVLLGTLSTIPSMVEIRKLMPAQILSSEVQDG